MERRTKVTAEAGKQELFLTREFDLPVDLLFKAHTDPELLVQWMSNDYTQMTVEKLETVPHGSWRFVNRDPSGNTFSFNGVIHDIVAPHRIIRTFQIEQLEGDSNVQLEFHTFEALSDSTSKLTTHTIFRTNKERDDMIRLGMSQGATMAHNRLQQVMNTYKS